ncbi:hypothetical protein BGX27_008096 [Mortierella sp. AM989]|nr:hypothetical protein BGX27_008096 [Mortierella sp. AM989]
MSNTLRAATVHSLSLYTSNLARTWRRTLSTTPVALAFEKKPLNKKITIPKDPYLLSEKVVKFARNGKLDDAITLVLEAPKTRQNEVVWNHLIQESSKIGKTNQSWQLLSDMKKRGFDPSDRTYTILLNALAINPSSPNSVTRAMTLYQQIKDNEDMSPAVAHTNALLKVCARKLDCETLQQVYKDMPKSGPNSPNVVTFNILINTFARLGGDKGFEMAWKVWEDCLEAKTNRPEEIDLDHALVDAILLACREAKSSAYVKRGYRLVESLYGLSLSSTGANTGGSSEETSALDKAITPGKSLGFGTILRGNTIQPRTVELLLSACIKLKDYGKAQRYMDLIRATYPDFKPDPQLLSSQMHFQNSTKEYEKAIQTWDEIKRLDLQHTPATFKQGLDASYKARNWEKTLEMYTEMRKLIRKNKDIDTTHYRPLNPIVNQQDAWTLVSTLKCAVKTKHIPEALQILRECNWSKVVQNSRYPRANSDVAELAMKIYSTALKNAKAPTSTSKPDSNEGGQQTMDISGLERELERAKDLHRRLNNTLAEYDQEKAQREAEEKEANRNRGTKHHFTDSEKSISLNIPEGREQGWRLAPKHDKPSGDDRALSKGSYKGKTSYQNPGTSRLGKTSYQNPGTSRFGKTSYQNPGASRFGKTNYRKPGTTTLDKPRYRGSGASTLGNSRFKNSSRTENAFQLSKTFSRDIY